MAKEGEQIYDSVAGDYDIIWHVPAVRILRPFLEKNLRVLQDWKGTSVLDMACGTGLGLRMMRSLGATKLVGIDISAEMISMCKQTTKDVDQFQLHVADCGRSLDSLGLEPSSFDLVSGFWLLNYAESAMQVEAFWKNIAKYLKPGAKFLGIIQNMDPIHPESMKHDKYGAKESNVEKMANGDGVKMHVEFFTTPKVEFDTFVLHKDVLETAAAKGGMKDIKYVVPGEDCLTEEDKKDLGWWRELLDEYPNQIIIATKA